MKIFNDQDKDAVCRIPLTETEKAACKEQGSQPQMSDITWRIFRIMAEFVDGFQFLSTLHKVVTVLGSARTPVDNKWYQEAVKLGRLLSESGFTVVTGGGPGIMEAANRGAYEAGGESVGINIQLPMEQRINPFVKKSHAFYYFFTRKVIMDASARAYAFFPGGFGTVDELMEILTLVQTGKSERVPIVLVGKEFWTGYLAWLKEIVYGKYDSISVEDLKLFTLVDSAEEAFAIIEKAERRTLF